MLRLTIVESPPEELPKGETFVVGPKGATLGRVKDNTWQLTDQSSLVSRTHCEVVCEQGRYMLRDTSTNGTFMDDADEPVGRGRKVLLNNGSRIRLGAYILEVNFETLDDTAGNEIGERPSFLSTTHNGAAITPAAPPEPDTPPLSAPVNHAAELPEAAFGDIEAQPLGDSPFEKAATDSAKPELFPASKTAPGQSTKERVNSLLADALPANTAVEPAIPENFLCEDPVAPAPQASVAGGVIPDDWYLSPAEEPTPSTPEPAPLNEPPPPVAPARRAAPTPEPAASNEPPTPAPEPDPTNGAATLSGALRKVLAASLGGHVDNLSERELLLVVEELVAIVDLSTPSLMQALAARTQVKDMMRLNQTMVQARDNNPLKFCDTSAQAIEHLLLNDHPGLLNGRLAVEEAFRELAAHQSALIAALQPALRETISRLSPEAIENAASSDNPVGFALPKGKGKLWEAYLAIFAKLAAEGRGNLEQQFMRSLAEHYERCVRTRD